MDKTNRILPKNARLLPDNAKKVFSGEIFDIYQWQQKMYDGSFSTFEMAKRTDTVKIIGLKNDKIIVLNEKQPDGTERFSSLPGGRVDESDASVLNAAKREMLEETGYTFKNWRLINARQPQRKIEWFIYTFLAWDITDYVPQKIDVGEKIDVLEISWQEFLEKGPQNTIFENSLTQYQEVKLLKKISEFK
jgi:8-oxo-dGTP pyrophosphatase MutT (NUDIX family)